MARDFKKASAGEIDYTPARNKFKCAAPRCPKPGSLTNSTHGSDTWYCAQHFFADRDDWHKLTHSIRNPAGQDEPDEVWF